MQKPDYFLIAQAVILRYEEMNALEAQWKNEIDQETKIPVNQYCAKLEKKVSLMEQWITLSKQQFEAMNELKMIETTEHLERMKDGEGETHNGNTTGINPN